MGTKTLDARRKNVKRVTKKMIEQAIIDANNGDKESDTVAKYHAAVNTKKTATVAKAIFSS